MARFGSLLFNCEYRAVIPSIFQTLLFARLDARSGIIGLTRFIRSLYLELFYCDKFEMQRRGKAARETKSADYNGTFLHPYSSYCKTLINCTIPFYFSNNFI